MTKHDFIFSDQRRHRLARHIAFWLVWCIAFNLLFWFPNMIFKAWAVYPTWNDNLRELGLPLFFIRTLIVSSFLGVIVPQILLIYVLMYWLLPNYFYKRRNYFLTAVTTAFVFIVFYLIALGTKQSNDLFNIIRGRVGNNDIAWGHTSPGFWPYFHVATQRAVIRDQLGSLPIILGLALMIKLVKKWWLKQKETELLAKEKTKAELQLLKAQVHPHFLFNTINNIYFFTLTNSAQAPVMIKKLSGLLHYILHECDQPLVPLQKELKMIQDYMALEKIRYAEQMQMTIDIDEGHQGKIIAPLLLIPFVENSFKHGASKMISQPWVRLTIKIENNRLCFIIKNSKPPANVTLTGKGNIGLKNVKKRLELLYPGTHELSVISEEGSYAVRLDLQLHDTKDNIAIMNELKTQREYAMA